MAYKKQLKDKNGNVIYPDVGLDLDAVVYSDDPTEEVPEPTAYIGTDELENGAVTPDKIKAATTYDGNDAITFDGAYVTNQATRKASSRGGIASVTATFQVGTSFSENQSFGLLPSNLRPAVRTMFQISGGKMGFVEPTGAIYALNGLSAGWYSLVITEIL